MVDGFYYCYNKSFLYKVVFYLVHQVDQSANASRVTSYNVLLPVQKLNKLDDGYAVYTSLSYFKYYNVFFSNSFARYWSTMFFRSHKHVYTPLLLITCGFRQHNIAIILALEHFFSLF